jgi:hypothetical protein
MSPRHKRDLLRPVLASNEDVGRIPTIATLLRQLQSLGVCEPIELTPDGVGICDDVADWAVRLLEERATYSSAVESGVGVGGQRRGRSAPLAGGL